LILTNIFSLSGSLGFNFVLWLWIFDLSVIAVVQGNWEVNRGINERVAWHVAVIKLFRYESGTWHMTWFIATLPIIISYHIKSISNHATRIITNHFMWWNPASRHQLLFPFLFLLAVISILFGKSIQHLAFSHFLSFIHSYTHLHKPNNSSQE